MHQPVTPARHRASHEAAGHTPAASASAACFSSRSRAASRSIPTIVMVVSEIEPLYARGQSAKCKVQNAKCKIEEFAAFHFALCIHLPHSFSGGGGVPTST